MLDIKQVRKSPDDFDAGLVKRGIDPVASFLIHLDEQRRVHTIRLQDAQAGRKLLSQNIKSAREKGDVVRVSQLMHDVARLKQVIHDEEKEECRLTEEIETVLLSLPNLPLEDVTTGFDESKNICLRVYGEKPDLPSPVEEHFTIGAALGLMDFELGAKLSGSRFVVLKGALARLERAISNFMLDLHTEEFGYTEISPPVLVRDHALLGTGQLPKFSEDQFRTTQGLWLIPTGEVPLTNLVRESILKENELPLRLAACTLCFRSEAGAAGRDTRGMIRQHQFLKLELVSITTPKASASELERMCSCAETVLKRLGLHYRVMSLCSGDMGFSACKAYDIEVWLPGQGAYREISSCSLCSDFQARRMQSRFRSSADATLDYVHTLNASGLAVGRTLVAILENCHDGGGVVIPDVLRPYMGGMDYISRL
ncbi:MAG: serine--tRNA ligase [Alphaproteobacteria bacterium]|nr:serine--tRNA ligase [Alphaproteobacteria bacterium]